MALRSQLNGLLPDDQKISVNDFIVKATGLALRAFPNLNASFAGNEIHVHNQVNIGIAVARETGLLTVVIRDCDTEVAGPDRRRRTRAGRQGARWAHEA